LAGKARELGHGTYADSRRWHTEYVHGPPLAASRRAAFISGHPDWTH